MRLRALILFSVAPFVLVGALIAAVVAVTWTDASDATRPATRVAAATTWPQVGRADAPAPVPTTEPLREPPTARDDQLHQDYTMTQYMSGPNASGPMFTGQMPDGQLQHSSDPAFVRELEQHHADMDRMLARGTP